MMEIGPWRIDGKGGFNVIEGGWEEYTTMVYGECFPMCPSGESNLLHVVDQPAGTGFSYTSTDRYAHTLTEVEAFYVSLCLL
jgi:carboxypeptidase D